MGDDRHREVGRQDNTGGLSESSGIIGEKFIQPCLLFLLHQKNAHGYELIESLKNLGISPDASSVYRHLRRMENEGLVKSEWDTGGSGPAKRHYKLTADGEDLLHSWVITIRKNKEILDNFLELYNKQISVQETCIPCSTGEICCDPSETQQAFVPVEQILRSDNKAGK